MAQGLQVIQSDGNQSIKEEFEMSSAIRLPAMIATLMSWACTSSTEPPPEPSPFACHVAEGHNVAFVSAHNNVFPDSAWTGTSSLLVWTQIPPDLSTGTIYLLPLDYTGAPANMDPIVVADEIYADRAQIVWTGEAAVVIWVDWTNEECLLTRAYDPEGAALGPAQAVHCGTDFNGAPMISQQGDTIWLTWTTEAEEDAPQTQLLHLSSTGEALQSPQAVAVPDPLYAPIRIGVNDDDGVVIAWEYEGLTVAAINESGIIASSEPLNSSLTGEHPTLTSLATDASAIVWSQSSFGDDGSIKTLHFADLNNLTASSPILISPPEQFVVMPSQLVSHEGLRAISWTDGDAIDQMSVHTAIIGENGSPAFENSLISEVDSSQQLESSINPTDGGFLVTWRSAKFHEADTIRVRKIDCD